MTTKTYFSVIIPTYNRADFIARTIQSVLSQKFEDFELIVVDDGSTDATQEVVEQFKDGRLRYFKKENSERGAARNFGVKNSQGQYITFLDSDDMLYPNHLATAFDQISQHTNPEIFHQSYEIKNELGHVLKRVNSWGNIRRTLIKGNPLSCIGVFVRRDIMLDNLFNEDYKLAGLEDWELWLRMAARYSFISSDAVTSYMTQHDKRSVITTNPRNLIENMERFIFHVFNNSENQRAYKGSLKKISSSARTYTALHLAIAGAPAKEVISYLRKGVWESPTELLRKRFLVTIKLMLFR